MFTRTSSQLYKNCEPPLGPGVPGFCQNVRGAAGAAAGAAAAAPATAPAAPAGAPGAPGTFSQIPGTFMARCEYGVDFYGEVDGDSTAQKMQTDKKQRFPK